MNTAVLNDLILAAVDRASLIGIEAIALATLAALPVLLIAYYPRWKRQQAQPEPAQPQQAAAAETGSPPTPKIQPPTPVEVVRAPSPRRQRHEALIREAQAWRQRAIASDAALLATAAIAVDLAEPRRRRA